METLDLIFKISQINKLLELYSTTANECEEHPLPVWFILMHLNAQDKPTTQNDIAKAIHVDKSTISRLIHYLEVRELVACNKTCNDGRSKTICITQKGQSDFVRFKKHLDKNSSILFEHLQPIDIQQMHQNLETLYYNLYFHLSK